MERLTKQWGKNNCNCVATKLDYGELEDVDENSFAELDKIIRKLAEYENLEEQGLLIKLPCKIGDNVYYIDDKYYQCYNCPNYNNVDCDEVPCPQTVKPIKFDYKMIPYIGTGYYITVEEAETEMIKTNQ